MKLSVTSLCLAVIMASGMSALKSTPASAAEDKEILYWVAPMDPGYRREKPGKSPMGMDLVPVYADAENEGDIVKINPVMVQNLGVRTAKVERGKLWRMIEAVGYVAFDERKLSHLHLRTDGWIEKLTVKSNGERVKKGDVLLELYSRELVNAQEEYIQALRGSNDYLTRASKERLEALGMSKQQIREVASKRRAFQQVRILASQDGIVNNLNVREGMYVKPSTEVLALADLSSVWLLVDVFERQSAWVAAGQPAEVRLGYIPGREWEGNVEFVYPTIDPKTRTLQARLQFDNPDETLKPDMYADVRIYAGPKENVLSIPREALIKDSDSQRVVLSLGEGRFRAVPVVAGMESGEYVEILEGLNEGDKVVTSAQFLIDSEASLRASFSRMGSDDNPVEGTAIDAPVMGMGVVNEIFAGERRVNISHEPIEALGWPAMTMDFNLDENASLEGITPGAKVHFMLVKDDQGNYTVDSISVVE
ncbi:Cu(I)/Ag(I) efflux system membrane fusion protein [Thiogranum longum]|uniref:Cu(I)/Ag(I) efflux system membrane fusion protein n=1 Tax=Thiogranum longum TaxID=1537524 RepID=A0A4V2PGV6_9GAMM|nr:efflux RND transporter periplasmic adaptor subunit [Thiogranum longum]TCK18336.1 Cu(I)/Ag(I) efflux system membrane fusion protein [Thiogranum longum]